MVYRTPAEVEEAVEVLADDVIDPSDPASLTLDIARSNPNGYAARFVLLSEEKQVAWLGRVSVQSLEIHFAAVRTAELRVELSIRDAEIVATGFAHPRSKVTFVKAASLATQTSRIARAVGLPFVLDVDAVLADVWKTGAAARRRCIPDLDAHAVRLRVTAPHTERGEDLHGSVSVELEWSSAALGGARKWATLAHDETTTASHEANADRALKHAKTLAASLGVGLSVL